MRSRAILPLALVLILGALAAPEAQSLRKIGEMELALVGLSATVDGARPAIPKNVASGLRILIRAGGTPVTPGAVARLLGAFRVEGELSGPSFGETVTVWQSVDGSSTATDLVLPLPVMALSGEHTLANLRIVGGDRPLLDLQPHTVPIDVVEQVLITSVKTRPLTLQEIKDKGIVLDSDDYLGFEFTLGLLLESKAVKVAFPVVFDRDGVALPVPQSLPQLRVDSLQDPISPPRILPMMLKVPKLGPGLGLGLNFDDDDIRIPSVLVIPGEVGYLRQFFSAQLFVGNGTPGTANLTVKDLTGTLVLPPGADLVAGSADDPLSPADTVNGVQPLTMAIAGVGADGAPGTADDLTTLGPGEQGQAEFLVRGDLEGYHSIAFDIEGVLDGLATGPIAVSGRATGGVLVRNPFFDVSFVVPTVVRRSEPFTLYATVTNKGQGIANDVSMTLDAAALGGVQLLGDASQSIATLKPGDARTLNFGEMYNVLNLDHSTFSSGIWRSDKVVLVDCTGCAAANGYPDDAIWQQSWNRMVATRSVPSDPLLCSRTGDCLSLYDRWSQKMAQRGLGNLSESQLEAAYVRRWTREGAVTDSPWQGIFALNLSRVPTMNAYNPYDVALRADGLIWPFDQRFQKPHVSVLDPFGLGLARDSEVVQYFGLLEHTEETLQPTTLSPTLVRGWAELAFWFQPVSQPAGTKAIGTDFDFEVDANVAGTGTDSHTYPTSRAVFQTAPLYREIQKWLKQ